MAMQKILYPREPYQGEGKGGGGGGGEVNFKFTAIVNNFRSARRLNSEWLPAMPTRPRVCTVYKDDFFRPGRFQ